jgi:HK97 gp10 family phage protein
VTADVSFKITGLDSLLGKLENLKYETKKKGGRFALRKAAQLVRDAAKQNAQGLDDPETGRAISDNIADRWNSRLNKQTGDLGFRVGVLQGARLPKPGAQVSEGQGAPTPHWRLLEFGTEKMVARPFMRPALANNIGAATDTFVREYEKAIDRAIKRAKKKGVSI